ncbi:DUF6879 family protein [Actinomycetospora aeridis]|uniref:DUF6879 family protein n=1 Tax=Actinomycetospora aeridis TaxID=3129231 RepID=A0ABU8N1S6_9PSEU
MAALAELASAISDARQSVFRAEYLQDYPDDPQWWAYQQGHDWTANEDLAAWCALVRANVERGVTMQRVHVVTTPWTPYVRFEIEQHYPFNLAAGEEVRLLTVLMQSARKDFWLVDDERGWLLDYADDGTMTVIEASERTLPILRDWRDAALGMSTTLAMPA